MKTVYKYPLRGDLNTLTLPLGAEPLYAAMQHYDCFLWVLVDPNEKSTEIRYFLYVETGHSIGYQVIKHISSFVSINDAFVGHVFEVRIP